MSNNRYEVEAEEVEGLPDLDFARDVGRPPLIGAQELLRLRRAEARVDDPAAERFSIPFPGGTFEAVDGSYSRQQAERDILDLHGAGVWDPRIEANLRRLGDGNDVYRLRVRAEKALIDRPALDSLATAGLGDWIPGMEERVEFLSAVERVCVHRSLFLNALKIKRRLSRAPVGLIEDAKEYLWRLYLQLKIPSDRDSEHGMGRVLAPVDLAGVREDLARALKPQERKAGAKGLLGRLPGVALKVVRAVLNFLDRTVKNPLGIEFEGGTLELFLGLAAYFLLGGGGLGFLALVGAMIVANKVVRGILMKSPRGWAQTLALTIYLYCIVFVLLNTVLAGARMGPPGDTIRDYCPSYVCG